VDNQPVTAAILNTELRDNMSDLNSRGRATVASNDTQFTVASGAEVVTVTHTIAANTLDTDGNTLNLIAAGTFAADSDSKVVRIRLGTTGSPLTGTIYGTITAANSNITEWWIQCFIGRIAANSQGGAGWAMAYHSTPTSALQEMTLATSSLTDSSAMSLVVTGDGINANDIVYERSVLRTIRNG
jgi:hypothetical protein